MWDPTQYGRYAEERARPFHDLLARVGAQAPSYVVDVGCGSGELTALLAQRWPGAMVEGVDSSAEMLAQAPSASPSLTFTRADVRHWRPEHPADVVLSSAAMQWVDEHEQVLRDLVSCLAPRGWLALQVPGNFEAPSHVLLREAVTRWLPSSPIRPDPVLDPAGYMGLLAGAGCRVDSWETTYLQVLTGPDPVLEWVKGTALRPVLAALPAEQHAAFLTEYGAALRAAYPPGRLGTLFPFRRVFAVAQA
jgi:trans-aconitate 2-methyltransferase